MQGTPKYQAILLSLLIIALYLSRCIYNIVVVQLSVSAPSYGYGWTNASDLVRRVCEDENDVRGMLCRGRGG